MRNELRQKLAVGLTLALAATTFSVTGALAAPEGGGKTSDLAQQQSVDGSTVVRSPQTGQNVRVPTFDSQTEDALQGQAANG